MIGYLIKGMWRGFVGGPDFEHVETLRFSLEDKLLSITVPKSNIVTNEPSRPLNFPYRMKGWFDDNVEREQQHCYVHVDSELWMYLPVIPIGASSEYGMYSLQLRIIRLADNTGFSAFDQSALAKHVIEDYDNFHNGPIDDSIFAGWNTEIIKRMKDEQATLICPLDPEMLENWIQSDINRNGYPPIAPAEIKTFNDIQWVYYQETKPKFPAHNDFYCIALDDNHYLECCFSHRVDRNDKHKKWHKHALSAQNRLMNSIVLSDYHEEQDILEHADDTLTV